MTKAVIEGVADIAHDAGALLVIDNVFATPILQKPLEHGADVVVYSATKHIDGQGRCLGGVVLGSAAYALAARQFRWEGFASLTDLRNQLVGAVLMGFGGVTALGCTIGQGISGVSTLAIGSFIALAGIIAGSVATLKYTLWREEQAG